MWATQLDLGLTQSSVISPVIFADAGGTGTGGDPLVGVGGGLSFLGGLMRINLAKGLRPISAIRFDFLFRAPR